jgi:hypothetical protein
MDERLSLKAVDDYSDDYSSKVAASFFAGKERITGTEIRNLSAIQQVNLFVIRELLHAWKHEGQKLRSPYFDYANPEVADALTKFHNLLSNNISITRENFQPLLKKAVSRTLYLIVDPYDFFSDLLEGQVQTDDLKNEIRYLKINKPPLERLVQRLEEKKQTEINGNGFSLLDAVLEEVHFTPEDPEEYLKQFSLVAPLTLEKLYDQKTEEPKVVMTAEVPPVVSPPPAYTLPQAKQLEIPVKPPEPKKEVKQPQPVAANHLGKIGRIKDNLTINQKFMFTKILFNGDFEIFTEAIDRLDTLDNIKQAYHYLEQNYPEWDRDSEEYEEFIELVQKRFS